MAMTPRSLSQKIRRLPAKTPIAANYERALKAADIWGNEDLWYATQKEHWLGWLSEYDGTGAYGRKIRSRGSAEFVYNHINCPPMLLWLAEAAYPDRMFSQQSDLPLEADQPEELIVQLYEKSDALVHDRRISLEAISDDIRCCR